MFRRTKQHRNWKPKGGLTKPTFRRRTRAGEQANQETQQPPRVGPPADLTKQAAEMNRILEPPLDKVQKIRAINRILDWSLGPLLPEIQALEGKWIQG